MNRCTHTQALKSFTIHYVVNKIVFSLFYGVVQMFNHDPIDGFFPYCNV